ncbi:hypothetical protein [Myroides odoratus]|uniref:hypothetical protein n=1 Tax=Myroides odoratus TaxID=256 RepID=UPI0039B0D21C
MAELQIIATNDNIAPERIGNVRIRVVVGQTVNITRADLTNSVPSYSHEFNRPIGGVKILGYGLNINNILRPSDTAIIATLTNNGQVMRYVNNVVQNGEVNRANLDGNLFKVKGNAIGSDYVEYTASAYNSTANTISDYINESAKLFIDVVSGTNLPPNSVGNNTIECPIGVLVPLNINAFTFDTIPAYGDPENDVPLKVILKIIGPPVIVTFNGILVQNNQEFFANDLLMGELKAFFSSGTSEGTISTIKFDVADVGSGQYSGL